MEYVAEDNEMGNVDDDSTKWNALTKTMKRFSHARFGKSDSGDEGYNLVETRRTDTTTAEAMMGKDIQGIHWDKLGISRDKYRQTRLGQYNNYEEIPHSGERSEKLRNLVWSTSKHDVYLFSRNSIVHWSSLSSKKYGVLNVSGHVAPCEEYPGSLLEGFTQTQISTLAVRDKLLIAGGFASGVVHFMASNNDGGV